MDDVALTCSSELAFFSEKDQVLEMISKMCNDDEADSWDSTWHLYESTLNKYLEQPLLLNSSLCDLVDTISARLVSLLSKV